MPIAGRLGLPSAAREYAERQKRSGTLAEKRAGSFWMDTMEKRGSFPYGGAANADYKVFRNVKDYGAKGDGVTDDTDAINRAIADGGRCGPNCGSSTVKGAVVYFPSGSYLISSPITMYYNTQMVGDATNVPLLLAAPSFVGFGLLSSDEYTGGNGGQEQWFINQNNFLRQVRNFMIDLTNANMIDIAGIHWQVAQATSLQNIQFFGSPASDKSHIVDGEKIRFKSPSPQRRVHNCCLATATAAVVPVVVMI